jgi:hypothetical protein
VTIETSINLQCEPSPEMFSTTNVIALVAVGPEAGGVLADETGKILQKD